MTVLKSWLSIDARSPFSIHNLPFGIISTPDSPVRRPAIAIGSHALDLRAFADGNGFSRLSIIQPHQSVFSQSVLNDFAALGRPMHRVVREYLQSVLLEDGPFPDVLQKNEQLKEQSLLPLDQCKMHLPMHIGDYTDFYAGLNHAYNVGVLFRGPQNALQPNYKHLPVGYHGRASSVVVSGTPIRRPNGQILVNPAAEKKEPILSPSKKLDLELELGCFICKSSALGEAVPVSHAPEHLFGVVLMNDWSARDIQAWEYVPLGPFNSKNFGTTISPWIVLMDALEPFATKGIKNDTQLLPYLDEKDRDSHFAIDLSFALATPSGGKTTLARTSATQLLFSFPQMLAHHTIGGCPFTVGDLMGSGTISGENRAEKGALLEQTENGKHELELEGGETRTFLQDGDTVILSGICGGVDGALVGFGDCIGTIQPAFEIQF
ncbi:hypothetical protein DOTSEDRAFT_119374 [Dothistroma septosporum NZE10]|uniref:Fumarylacetoacetase n=1 Tax=Dothistroma septosporum (strain NZE10 / CBS 128990) TaxID=675120 RepID=N1Q0E3_DOTSN|nr:hypothetical protein DOTSEDRAFT_119374 [Dothistroma septosporum NZE10]